MGPQRVFGLGTLPVSPVVDLQRGHSVPTSALLDMLKTVRRYSLTETLTPPTGAVLGEHTLQDFECGPHAPNSDESGVEQTLWESIRIGSSD